jgi:hypothetical protein
VHTGFTIRYTYPSTSIIAWASSGAGAVGELAGRKGRQVARSSSEAIVAGGEEVEEAEVAEDLELLANLVADVAVVRMQTG